MDDMIITIDNRLEWINGRNLDELKDVNGNTQDYICSLDSTKLINMKFSCLQQLEKITFNEIKKFLNK